MGKRRNQQPPEGGGGKFHPPETKRSLGDNAEAPGDDGSDTTGDTDCKETPAVGRTDDWGQTTGGGTGSANGEAAAPGATRPESPQRGNSVDEEEDLADEAEKDVPGQHGSAGGTETQTHRRMGDVGDDHEPLREAAGAVTAPPGDTGSVVPVEVPSAHREEESEHGKLGDTDQNQEPPDACVLNAEGSGCGAVSERAAGGETRENGSEQPRATGMSDHESCGSPECLGVCAPAVEGGTTGAESTGKMSGGAAAGREETGAGETPSPGAGLAPDPAVTAGGSPMGERDGEAAAVSAAGTDTRPPVRCEGTAEAAPAVTVTPAHTGTTEPAGAGTGTAEPTSTAEPTCTGTGTAERPGPGTGTTKPPGAAEPPGAGTVEAPGTTEAPGETHVTGELLPPWLELPPQQPPPATDWCNPAEPAPPGRSHNQEPPHREDATDVVCGLILELSNLNRLAMSTHRGLEILRRPKPRQSRRPVPPRAGRWWKET